MKINWHREKAEDGITPKYFAEMPIGPMGGRQVRVAEAVMTGRSGIDDYPWDWGLTDDGEERAYGLLGAASTKRIKTGGVADTLRSVKEHVSVLLNIEDPS